LRFRFFVLRHRHQAQRKQLCYRETESPRRRAQQGIGGADRPVTVTAKHPGCYTYSVGACTTPGTVYAMCGNADTQLIISAN
jgi:hypothetical protein